MPDFAPLALILLLAAGPALADDADADALSLADKAPSTIERASDWHVFVEGAMGESTLRSGGPSVTMERLSFDLQLDKSFAPGWRAVLADRLDLNWQNQPARQNGVNTFKEAYLSWQAQANQLFDVGRINARYGVASGYNPTDFFRGGANRSIVSIDPTSLKKNRLGSVMLRSQTLWNGGSLSALYSPKLAEQSNHAALNPDFGATNNRNRWLIALSQQLSEGINPQWLIHGEEHRSPQLGFNLTTLVDDATVTYIEWSGGRSPSLASQALNLADDTAFRNRLATGLTYTTANKLSVTLEYQYNGAGMDDADWNALSRTSPINYGKYRKWVQNGQDMPTRQAVFLFATWQDALINRVDLSAMTRFNLADRSRLSWVEARYRWDRADLALQWQLNSGAAGSEFGASPLRRSVQALVRYFF